MDSFISAMQQASDHKATSNTAVIFSWSKFKKLENHQTSTLDGHVVLTYPLEEVRSQMALLHPKFVSVSIDTAGDQGPSCGSHRSVLVQHVRHRRRRRAQEAKRRLLHFGGQWRLAVPERRVQEGH